MEKQQMNGWERSVDGGIRLYILSYESTALKYGDALGPCLRAEVA